MTKIDIYTSAIDRQIIVNRNWSTSSFRYVKIGSKFYRYHDLLEVNMLNETDNDQWKLGQQITLLEKLKFRIRLVLKVWRETK